MMNLNRVKSSTMSTMTALVLLGTGNIALAQPQIRSSNPMFNYQSNKNFTAIAAKTLSERLANENVLSVSFSKIDWDGSPDITPTDYYIFILTGDKTGKGIEGTTVLAYISNGKEIWKSLKAKASKMPALKGKFDNFADRVYTKAVNLIDHDGKGLLPSQGTTILCPVSASSPLLINIPNVGKLLMGGQKVLVETGSQELLQDLRRKNNIFRNRIFRRKLEQKAPKPRPAP